MPSAARKGDIGAAHGCFPSSPAIEGSGDVFIGDETWTGLPFDPPQPVLRLFLTQTPGNQNHPYTFEPYKLYKDGGMVQQGWTDEKGLIEYAYDPPWTYVLKVETEVGTFTFQPTPMHPIDTETGMQQRLDMLGFYPQPKHGNATNPGGKQHYEHGQGVLGGEVSGKLETYLYRS